MTGDTLVVIAIVLAAVGYLVWRAIMSRRKAKHDCDNCGH